MMICGVCGATHYGYGVCQCGNMIAATPVFHMDDVGAKAEQSARLDRERIEFIRRAAIAIWKSDRAANLLDRWAWARHEATLAWEAVREL